MRGSPLSEGRGHAFENHASVDTHWLRRARRRRGAARRRTGRGGRRRRDRGVARRDRATQEHHAGASLRNDAGRLQLQQPLVRGARRELAARAVLLQRDARPLALGTAHHAGAQDLHRRPGATAVPRRAREGPAREARRGRHREERRAARGRVPRHARELSCVPRREREGIPRAASPRGARGAADSVRAALRESASRIRAALYLAT